MTEDAPKTSDYLHAFTLYEDPGKEKVTSSEARRAYTDALKARGFKSSALDGARKRRHLPRGTRIGTFAGDPAALAAVREAEAEARNKHPGEFFLESAVLTPYRRVRVIGPEVVSATKKTAKAPAKPVAATPTRATSILDKAKVPKPKG